MNHDVAVGVAAPEPVEIDHELAVVEPHVLFEGEVRQARTLSLGHLEARVFVRDDLGAQGLLRRVAARVIRVQMRVDDVEHRLVGDLAQLRHDAVVVHLELVVDEHHAVGGDEHRAVARLAAADHVEVVADLERRELRADRSRRRDLPGRRPDSAAAVLGRRSRTRPAPPPSRLRSSSSLSCGSRLVRAFVARGDDVVADHRVVLVAGVLEELIAVVALPRQLDGPRRGPDHGIVQRRLVGDGIGAGASEALRQHVLFANGGVVERR